MSLIPIHVFAAGSDASASSGNPRRFNINRDGCTPSTQGWTKVMEFQAFNAPVTGAIPVYVAEAGGTGPTDPYRFLVDRSPGASRGWRDSFAFYAFPNAAPGTVPFYVMNAGGTSEYDRHRSEVTTNPTPHPGWQLSLTFFAYASAAPPPQNPAYTGAAAPPYPGGAAGAFPSGPAAPPSYTEATGQKMPYPAVPVAAPVRQQTTTIHTTVHHHHNSGRSLTGAAVGFLSALGSAAKATSDVMNATGIGGASSQTYIYISHTGFPPTPGPHRFRVSYTRNEPGWTDLFALRVFTGSHGNTMPVHVSQSADKGPERYRVARHGDGRRQGWSMVMKFHVYSYPAPGTVAVYVSEAGGKVAGDWHRFRVSLHNDAVAHGWTPVFKFYAYPHH